MGSPVVVASPRKSPSSGRRTNKPLVEKKRRARINGCLGQLKSLILSAMQTEGAQVSRLEKADILEMTVKYLRHVQHQQMAPETEVTAKFSAGYTECASEVIRYIDTVKCVTPDVKSRLENHLVERLRGSATLTTAVQSSTQQQPLPIQTQQPAVQTVYPSVNPHKDMEETMTRHYQTAVDLANMAASVALQSNTRSSLTTIRQSSQASASSPETKVSQQLLLTSGHLVQQSPNLESLDQNLNAHKQSDARCLNRSQSLSPSALRADDQDFRASAAQFYQSVDERLRHNGSEPAMRPTSSPLQRVLKQETLYTGNDEAGNNQPIKLDYTHVVKSESDYISAFQRPLHIHIPDSPQRIPSASPLTLHAHQMGFQTQRSQGADPAHSPPGTSMDDAPPTILYGYDGTHMASPYHKQETLSPCSPKTHENEAGLGSHNEYMETFDHTDARASTTFSHGNVRASSSRGGNHTQHVHSQHTRSPTLSPPTLTREEPYPCRITNPNGDELHYSASEPRQQNVINRLSHCYMPESGPYNTAPTPQDPCQASGWSNYSDRCPAQSNIRGQYQKQKERDSYHHLGPAQPYNCSHQSVVSQDPSERAAPHAKAVNNGLHALNGAPSHPHQKDTSLSPPTLKRRILCALGSGGEWTAPKPEERSDLNGRGRLQCVSDNGQNKHRRTDLQHESRTVLCRDVSGFLVPAANAYCRAVASHSGADENLWRPW